MKSFPSSFTKNDLVQTGLASTNIKQTLKNMAGAVMNNTLGGGNDAEDKERLGDHLKAIGAWKKYDFNESLANVSSTNNRKLRENLYRLDTGRKAVYENAVKIPASELVSINKYRTIYKKSAVQYSQAFKYSHDDTDMYNEVYQEGVSPSLFNPWYGVRMVGFTVNTPLMYLNDNENSASVEYAEGMGSQQITISNNGDFTDCSIKTLVNLYKQPNDKSRMGAGGFYRYADFMYCKELGQISNNHLITLRKFTNPIGDNIFHKANIRNGEAELIADQARLVTWFGTEDNKLEDICRFNYRTTWKPLQAELDQKHSKEDNPQLLPSLINFSDPVYRNSHDKKGNYGNNAVYNWIESASGKVFKRANPLAARSAQGADEDQYTLDANKVWTPKDTIQSTHIYEGKIEFTHEFTLVFNYELRSYDGINPKSAFLDLIGNILTVTHRTGQFWGGSRRWLGAPFNEKGWKTANMLFSKLESGAHNGIEKLLSISSLEDLGSVMGDVFKGIGGLITNAPELVKKAVNLVSDKSIVSNGAHAAVSTLTGMLKNKLGRPAIYALNSFLKDEDVGLWHVTVGNPRNPILTIGNLILENSELQHYGPLGIDDFPTGLRLTVKLKHAKPRDTTLFSQMYTCGQGRLMIPLNGRNYTDTMDMKTDLADRGFGGQNVSDIDGTNLAMFDAQAAEAIAESRKNKSNPENAASKNTSKITETSNSATNSDNNSQVDRSVLDTMHVQMN